jgi:hypothetical protein
VIIVAEEEAKRKEEGRNNAVWEYGEASRWRRDAVRRPRKVVAVISLGAAGRRSSWEKKERVEEPSGNTAIMEVQENDSPTSYYCILVDYIFSRGDVGTPKIFDRDQPDAQPFPFSNLVPYPML